MQPLVTTPLHCCDAKGAVDTPTKLHIQEQAMAHGLSLLPLGVEYFVKKGARYKIAHSGSAQLCQCAGETQSQITASLHGRLRMIVF